MKTYNHDWLIAEWERMGRPQCQMYDDFDGSFDDVYGDPSFFPEFFYHIKCKPWINWDHVHESVVAMATNKNGSTKFYAHIPDRDFLVGQKIGRGDSFPLGDADILMSFTQGTCDWKDSLVLRPVVIGETK